jgi:hypothetical protein
MSKQILIEKKIVKDTHEFLTQFQDYFEPAMNDMSFLDRQKAKIMRNKVKKLNKRLSEVL